MSETQKTTMLAFIFKNNKKKKISYLPKFLPSHPSICDPTSKTHCALPSDLQ